MPTALEPSKLGRKQYWDDLYTTEIENHRGDPSDQGTIWFDDSRAEDKIIDFLEQRVLSEGLLGDHVTRANCTFLDLGTGNGHFLMRLRQGSGIGDEDEDDGEDDGDDEASNSRLASSRAWRGRMLGVDYSEKSVALAREIATQRGLHDDLGIEFTHWDIMTSSPKDQVLTGECSDGWHVVLDKGTFDAISLSDDVDDQGRRQCESYRQCVLPLLKDRGLFLLTSCNWTVEELRSWFDGKGLEFVATINYPSFRFGGKQGQTISSVCYRRCVTS